MIGKMNTKLLKQSLHSSFVLFAIFILLSEGKYPQTETLSNKREGENGGQSNDGHNDTFLLRETHVGNIVKRSPVSLKIYQALYTEHSASATVSAYVDSTMTKLVLQVSVERTNPVIMAMSPAGIPQPSLHPVLNGSSSVGTVVGTVTLNITPADYGIWKFTKMNSIPWDVSVTGESTVDFSFEIIDNSTGAVITENPIQDKSYLITFDVPNFAQMKSVERAMVFSKDSSSPVTMSPLINNGNGKYEASNLIKMINKTLMIGIQGRDNSSNFFRRLSPKTIDPVSLKLLIPPYTGAKLYENKTLDINFTILNIGSIEQDIDVRIDDDKGFALAPTFLSATLKPGENYTGYFSLKGGNYNGEIVTATITARQFLGHGQFGPGPSETRQFTVENHRTTTTTTTTTTATTTTSPITSSHTSSASKMSSLAGQVLTGSAGSTLSPSGPSTASSHVAQPAGTGPGAVAPQSTTGSASGQTQISVSNSVVSGGSVNNVQPLASGAPSGTAQPATLVHGTMATGTGKTVTDGKSNSDSEFNKSEVLATAIISGICGGVLVGIGGLVVMGLVFNGAMKRANPNSVTPEHESDRVRNQNFRSKHLHDHDMAWT